MEAFIVIVVLALVLAGCSSADRVLFVPIGGSAGSSNVTECSLMSCDLNSATTLGGQELCLADGTNCPASSSGNPFDQNLNTTDEVQFADLLVGTALSDGTQVTSYKLQITVPGKGYSAFGVESGENNVSYISVGNSLGDWYLSNQNNGTFALASIFGNLTPIFTVGTDYQFHILQPVDIDGSPACTPANGLCNSTSDNLTWASAVANFYPLNSNPYPYASTSYVAAVNDSASTNATAQLALLNTKVNSSQVPAFETDSAHDTCAEISGCVAGAITDGNTAWDNSYGFITSNCSAEGSCGLLTYDSETTAWDKTASDDITTATSCGGNLSGTFPNCNLKNQTVTWYNISLMPADFADGVDNTGAGSSAVMKYQLSNVSTVRTTIENLTDLSYTMSANTNYTVDCVLIWKTNNTANGISIAVNATSATWQFRVYTADIYISGTTSIKGVAYNTSAVKITSTGAATVNTAYPAYFRANVRTNGASYTFTPGFSIEAAPGNSSIAAGSYCRYEAL